MKKLISFLTLGCVHACSVIACSSADSTDREMTTITETTTFARPDGTLDGTEETYEVPADEYESQFGTVEQPLVDGACLTDNETFYVLYGSSLGPIWANNARSAATSKLTTIANTTGVLPTFQPAQQGWDVVINPATAAEEAESSARLGKTTCSKVTKPGGGGTVSSKCTIKLYVNNIDAIYNIVAGARDAVLQFVLMHEYGHAQGLTHFTPGGAQCSDPVGSGTTCPWGSKPGGKDTVMSYCSLAGLSSTTYQYDGCELEELYWLIGQGSETNATSGTQCSFSPLQ